MVKTLERINKNSGGGLKNKEKTIKETLDTKKN